MSSSTTTPGVSTTLSTLFRSACAGLIALLLLVLVQPAHAQDGDDLPKIDFSADVMQSGQILSIDRDDTDPLAGFHAIRAGLNANVQFSERVSALVMIQSEPNDFGGASAASQFQPQMDFVILDLALTDELTLRTGTPVTGLMNFRGFSDGPVTQGNPMIGNSPADMITAGEGVKLIGAYESFGFDLTVNRGFGESISTLDGGNTGLNFIGKVRVPVSESVQIGGGVATQTGKQALVFANGDGENYNLANTGTASASRNTHAQMPNETILHLDGKLTGGGADVDLWTGYATESDGYGQGEDYQAFFAGVGLKYNLSDDFYAAGRFTYVGDQSDAVEDFDDTSLNRIQLGIGYEVYERALFKVEYVNQSETALAPGDQEGTALSGIGNNWQGVTTELSFNF
jgi:hypothetical protein